MKTSADNIERELLVKLRTGDYDAFTTLYQKYKIRLTGNIFKLVKSEELAEEVLQDLFLKVWEIRESIDPEKSFRSFLFRIAENLVMDIYRKAARDKKLQEQLSQHFIESYLHVHEHVANKETQLEIQALIDSLPQQCRKVFILFRVEGKTYSEITELLGISHSTINNHLVRANQILKDQLSTKQLIIFCILSSIVLSGI